MAAIKYELFFFLLSKLLSIGGELNNPPGAVQFSSQNGMVNSETWENQQSPQGNNFNTYYPTQDPQYNGMYPMNNQRQSDSELQYVVPRSIQQYDYQDQYYQTMPPMTNTYQQPPVQTPQITQSNPMLQLQSETLQSGQLNSNDGSVQFQQTAMQYPNNGNNLNTDYNKQHTAPPQETQSQAQYSQPQSPQSYSPMQNGQALSQSPVMYSETGGSQNQLNNDQNLSSTVPSSYDQIVKNTAGNKQMSQTSNPPSQPQVQKKTESQSSSVQLKPNPHLQSGPVLPSHMNPESVGPQSQSQNKPLMELPNYDNIANTVSYNQYYKQMSPTTNPLPLSQIQQKTKSPSPSVQLQSNPQNEPVLPPLTYPESVEPPNQSQNKSPTGPPNFNNNDNKPAKVSPITSNPSTNLHQNNISNHPTQSSFIPSSSQPQFQSNSNLQNEPVLPPNTFLESVGPQNQSQNKSPTGPSNFNSNDNKPAQVPPTTTNPSASLHQNNVSNYPTQSSFIPSSSKPQFQPTSNPQSVQKPSSYQPQPPKPLGPLQPKVPEVQQISSLPLQNKPNLPQLPPVSTNSNQLQSFSSQSQPGTSSTWNLTSLSKGKPLSDQNNLNSNPKSDLFNDLNSKNGTPKPTNAWENKKNDANNPQPISVNNLNNDIQKPYDSSPPQYTNSIESNFEVKLEKENVLAQTPTEPVASNYNDPLENKDFNDHLIANELARYDKSYSVDTEDPRSAMGDFDKFRVYANSNDVHIPNLPPIMSTNTAGNKNNINLQNPSSPSVSYPQSSWPNNNINQQMKPSPYQPQTVLPNKSQNQMFYSQMPISTTYNNNQLDPTLSNVGQTQMTSELPSSANRPTSMDNGGYFYKQVDLQNPPSYSTSWSLLNFNDPIRQRNGQQNYYSSNSQPSILTPPTNSQNNNLLQGLLSLPLNDMFIQNMITAISSSVQTPLYGTKAIFDVTQASFPNIPVIQQVGLTNSVVQSIALGLRKMWNRVMSMFGQRVKRSFYPLDPISSVFPSTTNSIQNLPESGSLIKKDYNSAATSTMTNMNQPYQQPAVDPYMMNTYYQPLTSISSPSAPFASFTNSQPAMSQPAMGQPTQYTLQQQQLQNGSGSNGYGLSQNNIGAPQLNPATANLSPENITDFLANEIKNTISSNLPPPYTMDSPEVKQYYRQLTAIIGIVFQNQINSILQGNSPL